MKRETMSSFTRPRSWPRPSDAPAENTRPKKRPKVANPLEGVHGVYDTAMHERLLSSPKNNFAFWDSAELSELERYLKRCKNVEAKMLERATSETRERFFANWVNALRAFHFATNLLTSYALPPVARPELAGKLTHYKEMFLNFHDTERATESSPRLVSKEDIRSGAAFPCFRVLKEEELRALVDDAKVFLGT
jgi:hypothetical protein